MDLGELSDLEEGEILECYSHSPVDSSDNFKSKSNDFGQFKKENINYHIGLKERNWCFSGSEKNGTSIKDSKDKHDLNGQINSLKSIDLESISSEGEYKSDDEDKYIEHKNHPHNGEKRIKRKHQTQFYGTVEDIMSAIGETICRKSRCNYKKRKSKDFFKYSDNSYNLWRNRIFSSHVNKKKRKGKMSDSDSELEFLKIRVDKKRPKKRRREVYYDEGGGKKPKTRDFDEMRRNLLEKLKKQEAEEKLKALTNTRSSLPEVENSEIQEVDMLIECTNDVDDPTAAVQNESVGESDPIQEKENEDEMDLIKLRLIALASNKKRKIEAKSEAPESVVEDKKLDASSKEVELDRTELLLRAEALKTALLKKHQKRLNKLKVEKLKATGSSSDNDINPSLASQVQKNTARKDGELVSPENNCAGNTLEGKSEEESRFSNVSPGGVSDAQEISTKEKKIDSVSNANSKKATQKGKTKRKKRKSCSLACSLKENSEKSEAAEEDDHTLRNQLLSDLMRKKSLKDSDKKPVLTDSMQASVNQIPSLAMGHDTPKSRKPPPAVKKTALKKVNAAKVPKAALASKIPVPEIQRIIVHLGSEDSSDENEENGDKIPVQEGESDTKVPQSATVESSSTTEGTTERTNEIIQASYEKSVELLLSEARKKIEGKMLSAKNSAAATPEAVYKHLPLSQRLEYIRLKQKIAERERLRIQSNNATSAPAVQETRSSSENPLPPNSVNRKNVGLSKTVSKLSPESKSANGAILKTTDPRVLVNKVKTNAAGVSGKGSKKNSELSSAVGSNSLLLPSSQALISKLKLLLKKIKIEKTIEENYEKEISKLKSQLSLFERKKTEQRFKIKKLGEESVKTYKAIQGITARPDEKPSATEGEVKEEKKAEEKKEEEKEEERKEEQKEEEKKEEKDEEGGKNVPNETETDISKAETKIEKEPNCDGDNGGQTGETVSDGTAFSFGLLEYISPLEVFRKASKGAGRVDPNVVMCQFDLMGVCKDEECVYQHLRTS